MKNSVSLYFSFMHLVKISPSVRIPSVVLTYVRMSLVCTVFFHHPRSSSPRACMALCVRAPLHLEVEQLHSPSCCMFCWSHRVSSHPVAELQISCVCLTTPCRSARATGNLCFLGEKNLPSARLCGKGDKKCAKFDDSVKWVSASGPITSVVSHPFLLCCVLYSSFLHQWTKAHTALWAKWIEFGVRTVEIRECLSLFSLDKTLN